MSEQSTVVKNALVTGASKGVGRGIAVGLARAGWRVGLNFHQDRVGAEQTAETIRSLGGVCELFQGDVGQGSDVGRMFDELLKKFSRLDLLVNNAGVQTWAPLLSLSEENWDRTIRTNLKGTFLCMQQGARLMQKSGSGCIINIGSGANKAPFPNLVDYCASKGGIQQLTVVGAVELGPFGIRVNCVAPGCIEIERTQAESHDYAGTWSPRTPLRRIGHVEDVADAVVFLAGDGAKFITGQTVYVDGGLWSQVPWPY